MQFSGKLDFSNLGLCKINDNKSILNFSEIHDVLASKILAHI
jgi:hypothetical protein